LQEGHISVEPTSDHISRVLTRHIIIAAGLPPRKVASFLQVIKDELRLKTAGIYSIPCKCFKVYLGQTRQSIVTKIKEHHQHIRLYLMDKPAMAKHSTNLDHHIQFQDIRVLATRSRCREATEIELHPSNMNRESFSLSESWKPLMKNPKRM